MIGDRALLGLVGGAVAVGMIWWSPSLGGDGNRAESAPQAPNSPAATAGGPRALAAALLTHLDETQVDRIRGTTDQFWTMAMVGDRGGASYFAGLTNSRGVEPKCQGNAVVCRTLEDGTLVTLRAKSVESSTQLPALVGWAYRPDGSALLLEVFTDEGAPRPISTAVEILEDPQLGPGASPEIIRAGAALDDFGDMELSLSVTPASPRSRQDAELRLSER